MNCPHCQSDQIRVLGKRHALYPLGIVAFIGVTLAVIHQAASPTEYQCIACGRLSAKRSRLAKFNLALLIAVLFLLVAAVGLWLVTSLHQP